MYERYVADSNMNTLVVQWNDFDTFKSYKEAVNPYPFITRNHKEYVINAKSGIGHDSLKLLTNERWLMKYDNNGLIHLNPRWVFRWPHAWLMRDFLDKTFGIGMHVIYRYRKQRLYIYRLAEGRLYGNSVYTSPYVKKYVLPDGSLQKEPIIINLSGYVVSGAIPFEPHGGYTTKW